MKARLYLETTVPSYLTARPSRDLIVAAHQQITREWWETKRTSFDLYVSTVVVEECRAGDTDAAMARLEAIAGITILEVTRDTGKLARLLMKKVPLPKRAAV